MSTLIQFQIQSKGNILAQGTERNWWFHVYFDAALAQAASPSARIIVYYFTSSGEIIADSIEFTVDALFTANPVSFYDIFLCCVF